MRSTLSVVTLCFISMFSISSQVFAEGVPNGSADVIGPSPQTSTSGNVKVCLNEDDGNCDFPMSHPGSQNADVELKLPLQGSITVHYFVEEIIEPGMGDAAIQGDTGVWIKADNSGASHPWASMRNPADGRTFKDYITLDYELSDLGDVHTIFSWNIPREESLFAVGDNTDITQFKNRSNIDWRIYLKVPFAPAFDPDMDITTDDDWVIYDSFYETLVEVTTDNPDAAPGDWLISEDLPFLYFEYEPVNPPPPPPPPGPTTPMSDEMVAIMAVITTMLLN